ncbi:hypothetical protein [Oceanicoccus sp. KOV_DT_Chl]|uniref:hypothetical protein n=1 Tax=Oceanicoccus sp. KOV_DT_Chl TaxID=1904639 RepID=UPI000C795A10|nr:hypothetical protein [Oceanicoccus sp. KOV_DT_Chl]
MNRVLVFLTIIFLFSCSEGIDLSSSDVDKWRLENKLEIEEIVSIFYNEPCLRRVELGEMKFIDQHCPLTTELSAKISKIQKLIEDLRVVLATTYRSDDNFNVSILLNRQGIAVSGSGLALDYWEVLESPWTKMLECGEMEKLSDQHWYIKHLVDGPSCY